MTRRRTARGYSGRLAGSRTLPVAGQRRVPRSLLRALLLLLWLPGLLPLLPLGRDAVIPEPIGPRTAPALCLAVAQDLSNSTSWTDPHQRAWAASRQAMAFLRDHAQGTRDYVAVYYFGGTVEYAVPPVPLSDGWSLVEAALQHPGRTLGGTDFVPVFDAVGSGWAACPPGTRRSLVIVTDGRPSDEASGEFERIGAAVEALAVAPAHIHLVALDDGGGEDWRTVEGFWRSLGFGSITRIAGLGDGELEQALGRLLVDELGMTWGGGPPAPSP